MKIFVDTELRHGGRSGVEARAPELQLAGHGTDEQAALQSLQKGILAWCSGLQSVGRLEQAIKQRRLKWEADGTLISIELILPSQMG